MIPNSFQIARIAGVPVRVHILLPLLVLALAIRGAGGHWGYYFGFTAAVFVCIALHEFGHVLAARLYGISTREVILHPLGGLAILSRTPRHNQQIWISLAGPAVNIGIATLLFLAVGRQMADPTRLFEVTQTTYFIDALWRVNLFMALFNLLPAYPLDGGQLLRALLTPRLGEWKATRVATGLGQVFGVAFAVYGLVADQLLLTFVGIFVFTSSMQVGGLINVIPRRQPKPKQRAGESDYRGYDYDKRMQTELERRKLKELFERSFKEGEGDDESKTR